MNRFRVAPFILALATLAACSSSPTASERPECVAVFDVSVSTVELDGMTDAYLNYFSQFAAECARDWGDLTVYLAGEGRTSDEAVLGRPLAPASPTGDSDTDDIVALVNAQDIVNEATDLIERARKNPPNSDLLDALYLAGNQVCSSSGGDRRVVFYTDALHTADPNNLLERPLDDADIDDVIDHLSDSGSLPCLTDTQLHLVGVEIGADRYDVDDDQLNRIRRFWERLADAAHAELLTYAPVPS